MASPGGIRAGQAYVELFADDRLLQRGLRSAQQRLKAFGDAVRAIGVRLAVIGTAIAAPLLAATRQFVSFGDQLDKMAIRTGLSVEALSELAFAAESSGTSLEAVETSVRVMQRTLAAAGRGSTAAIEPLHALDLSVERLIALSPEQQFEAIALAITRIADPTVRAATAMRVFGRSGTSLLPLLKDLPALRAEAQRLGLTMRTDQASAAATLSDAFDRVQASIRSTSVTIGSALAPMLKDVAARIVAFLIGLRAWIGQNQGLVVAMLKVAAATIITGAVLIGAGIALKALGVAIGVVSTALGVLHSVLGLVVTVLGVLVTPMGAVIAASLALGAAVLFSARSGVSGLTDLGTQFLELRDDAIGAWHGIADALSAGDIALAARILWLTLKLEWQRGVGFLKSIWIDATTGMAIAIAKGLFQVQTIWAEVVGSLTNVWTTFTNGIAKAWTTTSGFLAKSMAKLAGLFDTGFDVAGVTQQIDQEVIQRTTAIDEDAAVQQAQQDERINGIQSDRDAVLQDLGDQSVSDQQTIADDLATTREEFQNALAQARAKRTETEKRVSGDPDDPPTLVLPDLDALSASLDVAAHKLDVSGTFNASAVGQLGVGGSASERTAKATEDTARNTARIVREMGESGLEFE
ncbi:MAG: phage tail tape measure protein [Planctomycetes bacterium]|nr:phage tail tape measure protein [Planctomycetota bacterium]